MSGETQAAIEDSGCANDFYDAWDESDYDDFASCHFCGGDGFVWGDDLDDPLWYDAEESYRCPCCHGSGKAKDCTFW